MHRSEVKEVTSALAMGSQSGTGNTDAHRKPRIMNFDITDQLLPLFYLQGTHEVGVPVTCEAYLLLLRYSAKHLRTFTNLITTANPMVASDQRRVG